MVQEIRLSYATIEATENGIVRLEIFGDTTIGFEEAREMNDAIGILSGGKETLVLILADEITQFKREAMDFSSGDEGLRYTIADALVVKSLAQRITANFYLAVNAPKKPSKIFNTEEEARKWLISVSARLVKNAEL
jgi:hypothetical protein